MIERYWKNYKWRSEVGYYDIYLQHNLLGRWSVISVWGKDIQKSGQIKINLFDTLREAMGHVSLLNKDREEKYRLDSNSKTRGTDLALEKLRD